MIANDFAAVCGIDTTANEIQVIDNIFKLNEIPGAGQQTGIRADVVNEL